MTMRSGQLDWLLVEFVRDTPGVVNGDRGVRRRAAARDLAR